MEEIEKTRKKIDETDEKIKKMLRLRLGLINEIATKKQKLKIKKISIRDKKREEEILSNTESNFEREIFKKILIESRKIQKASLTRKE